MIAPIRSGPGGFMQVLCQSQTCGSFHCVCPICCLGDLVALEDWAASELEAIQSIGWWWIVHR